MFAYVTRGHYRSPALSPDLARLLGRVLAGGHSRRKVTITTVSGGRTRTVTAKRFAAAPVRRGPRGTLRNDSSRASVSDAELVEGLLARNGKAWAMFHEKYDKLIYSQARKIVGNKASDAVEEVHGMLMLSLLENDMHKLRAFDATRGYSKFSSWIGLLANRAALDHVRSLKRKRSISGDTTYGDGEESIIESFPDRRSLHGYGSNAEQRAHARQELARLSSLGLDPIDMQILAMKAEDIPSKVIAKELGIASPITVDTRARRARIALAAAGIEAHS